MHTQRGRTEESRGTYGPDVRLPVLGEVISVWTRTTTDDTGPDAFSNHEASVKLQSEREEPRRFPIHPDFNGTAAVPKPGDLVRVEYTQSNTERPAITGYAYADADNPHGEQNRPPLARAGHWRREFNNLYIEAERSDHAAIEPGTSEYDIVRLAKKADGLSDPDAQVELDDSGSDLVIRVTRSDANGDTDMGLVLDLGTGEFKIGDGSGYGIESDGSGNFTWHHQDINLSEDTTITW